MDKITKYQTIIATTLKKYATSNVPGMEDQVILDFENNHFQLITIGWNDGKYIFLPLIHFDIKPDGKIWLMANNTDVRIAEELVEKGIPRNEIVIGFQPAALRSISDYASA